MDSRRSAERLTPLPADGGAETRARRGLGLLAMGYPAEAAAELNGLIAESQDPRFLFRRSDPPGRHAVAGAFWLCHRVGGW